MVVETSRPVSPEQQETDWGIEFHWVEPERIDFTKSMWAGGLAAADYPSYLGSLPKSPLLNCAGAARWPPSIPRAMGTRQVGRRPTPLHRAKVKRTVYDLQYLPT